MKRLGHLFDILLLTINSIGIVGALTEILQIPWRNDLLEGASGIGALDGRVFWPGLFFFCTVSIVLWRGTGAGKLLERIGLCVFFYLCLGLLFRRQLQGGVTLALQNAVEILNRRFPFHIARISAARVLEETGLSGGGAVWASTFGILYLVFPFELLAGLFWKHGKAFLLLAGNILWFTAACAWDIFPGYFFLAFCVLGMAAALIQAEFRGYPGAGIRAVTGMAVFAGAVMAAVWFFLLPKLDLLYEVTEDKRLELYRVVNNEWIPGVQSVFSGHWLGIGSGPDVTGELYRNSIFSHTENQSYQVSVDRIPQSTIYLKGFVGTSYAGTAWEESTDRELKRYYEEQGLPLPGEYRELVNMSYEALGGMRPETSPGYILIEELGGKGSYSLYPYGALLTEEFQVHGDGSVEREGKSYGFRYYFPELGGIYRSQDIQQGAGQTLVGGGNPGYDGNAFLPGTAPGSAHEGRPNYEENASSQRTWEQTERDYRRYVYDSFLEYPEEELPVLTRYLSRADINRENISDCVLDIMRFLDEHAVYNLDVGRNPLGTDFVEYFLFEKGEGYCAHFASAAVLALRYFWIPARYATGYAVSPSNFTSDGEGGYRAVLTGRQAHAWAEIYLNGIGWIPVEMTPGAAALSGEGRRVLVEQAQQLEGQSVAPTDREKPFEEEEKPEESRPSAEGITEKEELPEVSRPEHGAQKEEQPGNSGQSAGLISDLQEGEGNGAGGADMRFLLGLPAVLLLLLAVGILLRSVRHRRLERLRRAKTREKIFLLYRNMREALRTMGCPGRFAVDEENFWQALQRIAPRVTREEYEVFCGILEKNTFGNMPPSEGELQTVCGLHDRLIEEIYKRAPVYRKIFLGKYRRIC